jgi:hypothetical protein
MEFLPKDVLYTANRMSNYQRNRFRLETVSAETASANRIVTVNLPEGSCVLDMRSFAFHFNAHTTRLDHTDVAEHIQPLLPADASSLISRVEVYVNGVQIQGALSEYDTATKLLNIGRSNRDREMSVKRALAHGAISSANDVDSVSIVMSDWLGFLGESTPRYLSTDLVGQIQVRITFAGNHVLSAKKIGVPAGSANITTEGLTLSPQMKYTIDNMFFTIDSVSISDDYTALLRQRLQSEEYISIFYPEYYSFSMENINGSSHTTRFSLSVTSLDRIFATFRDSNYNTTGIPCHRSDYGTFAENLIENAHRFQAFNDSNLKAGSLRYHFTINNVRYPQYSASGLDALFELALTHDKIHDTSNGNLVTSLNEFYDSKFCIPLTLCHPTAPKGSQTGYNSKGINSQLTLSVSGQTMPTAGPGGGASQATDKIASYILCETTAELRCKLGRNCGVVF